LPKQRSQSGRRLFVVVRSEERDELWLEVGGQFRRWILHPDVAEFAGEVPVRNEYYSGNVPSEWRGRVQLEDAGAYEVIEGSYERGRLDLWFSGKRRTGEWTLEKIDAEESHRSWRLSPVLRLHLPR
jgi:hypothetical protein